MEVGRKRLPPTRTPRQLAKARAGGSARMRHAPVNHSARSARSLFFSLRSFSSAYHCIVPVAAARSGASGASLRSRLVYHCIPTNRVRAHKAMAFSNSTWAFTGTRRNALLMTLLVFAWWVLPHTRWARVIWPCARCTSAARVHDKDTCTYVFTYVACRHVIRMYVCMHDACIHVCVCVSVCVLAGGHGL
jgi:hypothetical protein